MTKQQIISLVMLGVSVAYDLLPVDLIPDVPFIGWVDDFLVTSSAAINCLQQFNIDISSPVYKVAQWLKWICIALAVLIALVVFAITCLLVHYI